MALRSVGGGGAKCVNNKVRAARATRPNNFAAPRPDFNQVSTLLVLPCVYSESRSSYALAPHSEPMFQKIPTWMTIIADNSNGGIMAPTGSHFFQPRLGHAIMIVAPDSTFSLHYSTPRGRRRIILPMATPMGFFPSWVLRVPTCGLLTWRTNKRTCKG